MDNYTAEDIQAAQRPLASLISKSEKARQKLAPGTWQHKMLQANLKALYAASALMNQPEAAEASSEDLQAARQAFAMMIERTEKALKKASPGRSQHSLLQNRLKALGIAAQLIERELVRDDNDG